MKAIRASFSIEEAELLIDGLGELLRHDLNSFEYGKEDSDENEAEAYRRFSGLINYLTHKVAKAKEPTE